MSVILIACAAAAFGAGVAVAADNSGCLACHGTEATAPSQTIAGKTVSLYVDPTAYGTSKHGTQACTACHGEFVEAHDQSTRTYGSWARFSASASTDTTATWNFWKVDGNKCVTCHSGSTYTQFFSSDHSTAWNLMHNPDGTPRLEADVVGSDDVTYHTNEDYTEANCGRCHMGNNCATCHWKTPIVQNPKNPTVTGDLLDWWSDYSSAASTLKTGLAEYAIDWTQNIATHDFRTEAELESSNVVCSACHIGFPEKADASIPAIGIYGIGMKRHGQTQELLRAGARGVHETLQQCTDCHSDGAIHGAAAPESMLQWRQDHDVNCVDCHPDRTIMGAGVPHQNVDCTACHATQVDAILDPDGGGAGVPLIIPRVVKHNVMQGWPTHDLRRDTECSRCHVAGGALTGAPPMSAITAIDPHIDVTAPVTKALAAVSVVRYRKATFKYRVDDVQSVTATVTIKIRNSHGKVVKTFSLGKRAVNTSLVFKARITLAKGTYTWTVYARDAAGNAQASPAGRSRLTVK